MATKFSHSLYTGKDNGYSGQRAFVGDYAGSTWWLRCEFKTGANYVSDITYRAYLFNGSSSNLTNYPIGCVITTSSSAYINAGAGASYEATMKYDTSVSGYNASVKINKILNPNTTYYLFLCPNFTGSFRHYFYDASPTYVGDIWGEHNVASTVSATNANITEFSTIVINRYGNSFTHELTWTFGNLYGTIASKTSETSIKWTLPESLYTQIPNATSGVGTITCTTYNGSTIIGTNSCQFRATASVDKTKPTLNPTVKDISPETIHLTGNEDILIKYYSDVEINVGASARASATLTAVNCACAGKSIGTMTGVIYDIESPTFTFTATDSRGYTTVMGITKSIVDYVKLTTNCVVPNPTALGETTLTISGNYYNGTFGKENNTLVVLYRIKENDGAYGEWQTASPQLTGNTYKAVVDITGLNYLNSYTFQARAFDMLETIDSKEVKVKTIPVFDWSENDFNFNVPVVFSAGYTVAETSLVSDAYDANSLMSHKLIGVINALTNGYALQTTYTAGTGYSSVTGTSSYLIGNNLRCYFNATRSAATGAGNIGNETVCTIKIHHGGKIKAGYNVSVPNGATGGLAGFSTTNMEVDDTYITFDISLSAVDVASTQFSTYFTIPVAINLDAYV